MSVRLHGTRLPLDGFWHLIFELSSKICSENSSFIKSQQEEWVLYRKTFSKLQHLAEFFLECETFQIKVAEKIRTHIWCSINFFPGNRVVYEIMYVVETDATNDNTKRLICVACWISKVRRAHAHTPRHPERSNARAHTHREIRNTYSFSTATMVSRSSLIFMLYAHCLSCYNLDGERLLRGTSWIFKTEVCLELQKVKAYKEFKIFTFQPT